MAYTEPAESATESSNEIDERKRYGTCEPPNFAALMPNAGDPAFDTDAQNNDEYFRFSGDRLDDAELNIGGD